MAQGGAGEPQAEAGGDAGAGRNLAWRIERALLAVLLLCLIATSAVLFRSAYSADGWLAFSRKVERSTTPPLLTESSAAQLDRSIRTRRRSDCFYGTTRAKVTTGLALVDEAISSGADAASRVGAVMAAREAMRAALLCEPTASDLWRTQALMARLTGAPPQDIWAMTVLSVLLAPAEAYELRGRWAFALHLPPPPARMPPATRLLLVSDLSTALADLKPEEILPVYRALCAGPLLPLLREAMESVPETRRALLLERGCREALASTDGGNAGRSQ